MTGLWGLGEGTLQPPTLIPVHPDSGGHRGGGCVSLGPPPNPDGGLPCSKAHFSPLGKPRGSPSSAGPGGMCGQGGTWGRRGEGARGTATCPWQCSRWPATGFQRHRDPKARGRAPGQGLWSVVCVLPVPLLGGDSLPLPPLLPALGQGPLQQRWGADTLRFTSTLRASWPHPRLSAPCPHPASPQQSLMESSPCTPLHSRPHTLRVGPQEQPSGLRGRGAPGVSGGADASVPVTQAHGGLPCLTSEPGAVGRERKETTVPWFCHGEMPG